MCKFHVESITIHYNILDSLYCIKISHLFLKKRKVVTEFRGVGIRSYSKHQV